MRLKKNKTEIKKPRFLVFDFETNNSDIAIAKGETNVWLYDIYDVYNNRHYTGATIDEFFDQLFNLESNIIYAHNLKFDGNFIISWLLRSGFTWVEKNPDHKQFTTLISDMGQFYSIKIGYDEKEYDFRDSMKKIDGSVADMAFAYGLELKKGEIDYRLHRPEGYQATREEKEYIWNDTEIVANVLKFYYENAMTRMTTASDTMALYRKSIGENLYTLYFPELSIEVDDFIRESYRGGCCILNKKYASEIVHDIKVYDVNSMYPYQMCEMYLPYGEPRMFYGKYSTQVENSIYDLYIQKIKVDLTVKENHYPSILVKNWYGLGRTYIDDTEGEITTLVLTNVDMDLMFDNYEIHYIEYCEGMAFRSSRELFRDFMLPLYEKKNTTKGAQKILYKKLLNSLYGKFAMNPRHRQKIPKLSDDGKVVYEQSDISYEKPIYTAVASFITSYARKHLFNAINNNLDSFIYCDTDSVHLLKEANGLEIHSKKLGAWKLENEDNPIIRAKYIGQKCYIHEHEKEVEENSKLDRKIAACPKSVKSLIDFDNFKIGMTFDSDKDGQQKLRPKLVKNGVILVSTPFSIKER